ncbi:MAG: hypothetical protein ABI609_05530 [Acidobacteriota bacterium]
MLRKKMMWAMAVLTVAVAAQAQTVDELIAKNLAARGGKEKILAIQSAKLTGKMSVGPGVDAPFTMEWRRPSSVRLEFTVQGMTGVQAYDGTTGWMLMPSPGKSDPETMADEDLKDVAETADFDGPLVDYRSKGHSVELIGKEAVAGADAYKLKLTKKGGEVSYVFLDAESSLEVKTSGSRALHGEEHEFETSSSDYKEVSGILFPFTQEMKAQGAPAGQVMTIETIDLNTDEPADRFKMPEKKPAEPAKPPVR